MRIVLLLCRAVAIVLVVSAVLGFLTAAYVDIWAEPWWATKLSETSVVNLFAAAVFGLVGWMTDEENPRVAELQTDVRYQKALVDALRTQIDPLKGKAE